MKTKDIDSLVRPNILSLQPYSTARDEYSGGDLGVFLDANESPYQNGVNRYPDPHQKALKARISAIKGTDAEHLFLGNGSDEAIDLIFRVFCRPGVDNVVAIAPSYGMYSVAAATNDIALRTVQLPSEDWSLPSTEIMQACDSATRAIFLCSPNNPTGNAFPVGEILSLAESFDGILVVDEAYIDFSSEPSLANKVDEYNNLVVLQTLSKAWGMAGLRIGLAIACPRIISLMSMVKYPYNINVLAQAKAMELLAPDTPYIEEIISERAALASELETLPFITKVWKSDANFILVRTTDADAIYNHLIADGIIVRNRNRVKGCEGCLRLTIGLKEENRKLIESLRRYEESNICR